MSSTVIDFSLFAEDEECRGDDSKALKSFR